MTIERREFPQFFITAPSPCPYLPGKMERKVFTHLMGKDALQLHDTLSDGGFRRSQNIAYRPACEDCAACLSTRVMVESFNWSASFLRVMKKNKNIVSKMVPAVATSEHYSLFAEYIDARHFDGGMSDMTVLDFSLMVDDSAVDTRLIEYRIRKPLALETEDKNQGELVGVALVDVLKDGLSMIYSFFNPNLSRLSPGTFMILDHIKVARKMGLSYVYLGFWVENSEKMAYKSRFLPQQRLGKNGWDSIAN